eukprot:scaffold3183_cov120-Isochrysis_galbana.AAC.12
MNNQKGGTAAISIYEVVNNQSRTELSSNRAGAESDCHFGPLGWVVEGTVLAPSQHGVGCGKAAAAGHLVAPEPRGRLLTIRVVHDVSRPREQCGAGPFPNVANHLPASPPGVSVGQSVRVEEDTAVAQRRVGQVGLQAGVAPRVRAGLARRQRGPFPTHCIGAGSCNANTASRRAAARSLPLRLGGQPAACPCAVGLGLVPRDMAHRPHRHARKRQEPVEPPHPPFGRVTSKLPSRVTIHPSSRLGGGHPGPWVQRAAGALPPQAFMAPQRILRVAARVDEAFKLSHAHAPARDVKRGQGHRVLPLLTVEHKGRVARRAEPKGAPWNRCVAQLGVVRGLVRCRRVFRHGRRRCGRGMRSGLHDKRRHRAAGLQALCAHRRRGCARLSLRQASRRRVTRGAALLRIFCWRRRCKAVDMPVVDEVLRMPALVRDCVLEQVRFNWT